MKLIYTNINEYDTRIIETPFPKKYLKNDSMREGGIISYDHILEEESSHRIIY